MLGFAPLSSVPLSSLPSYGTSYSATPIGPVVRFGTPTAIWDQFAGASGFTSGHFGTPSNARAQPAIGFTSGAFGTPFGHNIQVASGFTSGDFGAPRLFPFHVGPGIHSSQFGTPSGRQYWQAYPLIQPGHFGTPFITFNQTRIASGFTGGNFGNPLGMRVLPPNTDRICIAQPVVSGHFGTPRLTFPQSGVATSIHAGNFGTPRARMTLAASGIAGGQFGAPSSRMVAHARGFRSGNFGTPRARMIQQASSVYLAPRWGQADSERSNTYRATSIYVGTRMGQPTGTQRFNYKASGFTSGNFGTPTCRERHRAASIPPSGRFGTPILRRNTQC